MRARGYSVESVFFGAELQRPQDEEVTALIIPVGERKSLTRVFVLPLYEEEMVEGELMKQRPVLGKRKWSWAGGLGGTMGSQRPLDVWM